MKKSSDDYYKTLAGCLRWLEWNFAIYNGYVICAHPKPDPSFSQVKPGSLGYFWVLNSEINIINFAYKHREEEGKEKPIWKILREIDKIILRKESLYV